MDLDKQKKILEISKSITDGDITNVDMTCPYCINAKMIFSFTVIKKGLYGLFIDCKKCGHRTHFILSRPRNFNKKYILPEYQKLEDQAIEYTIRKKYL